jgi:Ca-activated chloride channel family protein
MLLLLLAPAALAVYRYRRARAAASLFTAESIARAAGATWRTRLRRVPGALRFVAIALIAVAIARPQAGFGEIRTSAEGVAIMMVLDRSSSMNAEMPTPDGPRSRFDVAQRAFQRFVTGEEGTPLEGRPHDLLGLIAFARYPETIAPLSGAQDAVAQLADTVETARRRAEDGTAIGDAVALAAARLHEAEKDLIARRAEAGDDDGAPLASDFTLKSKVIILLTDGENNAGEADPRAAARLAAEWGVTIYAIGVSGDRVVRLPGGIQRRLAGTRVDEQVLSDIAEITGGFYRPVEDASALEAVYEEIDRLEKTEITTTEYTNYDELFPPVLYAALALLALEAALRLGPLRSPL